MKSILQRMIIAFSLGFVAMLAACDSQKANEAPVAEEAVAAMEDAVQEQSTTDEETTGTTGSDDQAEGTQETAEPAQEQDTDPEAIEQPSETGGDA